MWPQEEKRARLGRKLITSLVPERESVHAIKGHRVEAEDGNKGRAWATVFTGFSVGKTR